MTSLKTCGRLALLTSALGFLACSDDTGTGASGGSAGSSHGGQAGSPSQGGTGGDGVAGGAVGGTGIGGTGVGGTGVGGTGQGGNGGQGGSPSSATPECQTDADCYLNSDCCECAGRPVGELPPQCAQQCIVDNCQALKVLGDAQCVAGRCVAPASCDASNVICAVPPPDCPAGQAPIIENNCPTQACLDALECNAVTDCKECEGTSTTCVNYVAQLGTTHCVSIPDPCTQADCACVGPSVCQTPFDICSENMGEINCGCPTCSF